MRASRTPGHFREIDGLRIYLALWVAVGHGLQLSGFLTPSNFLLKLALDGHAAVVVFMIVSGFVITTLLLGKQESYPRYILRRFFRLYPAYVMATIIGYFVAGSWADIVSNVPYRGVSGWTDYAALVTGLRDQVILRFWPHALLHATMLHGIVPTEILPHAPMTFSPAAWSISLEWQFYLVAPMVLLMIRKPATLALLAGSALLVSVAYTRGYLGTYYLQSSLSSATPYFAVGIASRLAYPALSRIVVNPLVPIAVLAFLAITMLAEPTAIVVWGVFLSLSLWRVPGSAMSTAFTAAFMSTPAVLLGEASYSLYLLHQPVQVILGNAAMHLTELSRLNMFAVQLVAIAVAIPVSLVSFKYIEQNGTKIGKRLANRLPGKRVVPDPAPIVI